MTKEHYEEQARANINSIPRYYKNVLKYLLKEEGNHIHRNRTESDITTAGGVYRAAHPSATIFTYIDIMARRITNLPSDRWDKELLKKIDHTLDKDTIYYLLYDFYKTYLKGAHIVNFPVATQLTMVSLYTNSMIGAWKSVQIAIWDMYHLKLIPHSKNYLSTVDGLYGAKTRDMLLYIKRNLSTDQHLLFRLSIIAAMKSYYIKLAAGNPSKYAKYLKGWNNRMDKLKYIG